MITQTDPATLLNGTRHLLGLPGGGVDEVLVACLLRRVSPAYCPCSPTALKAAVRDSLRFFPAAPCDLDTLIDACIEGLMIAGDLLEIARVSTEDPRAKGTWLFIGPPSFFQRVSGTVVLFGCSSDGQLPLPSRLVQRIQHNRWTRTIVPDNGEDLASELDSLGFIEQSERMWLRAPSASTATAFQNAALTALDQSSPSGDVQELRVLDDEAFVRGGSRRWLEPRSQSGRFIARRPQAYGAELWCLVQLENGRCQKLVDLPLPDAGYPAWRGCDFAWQLAMAFSAHRRAHGRYLRSACGDKVRLAFHFPLPLWATRRLEAAGERVSSASSLLTYCVPEREAVVEEQFLQDMLWVKPMPSEL
jgi:hypothetical protein